MNVAFSRDQTEKVYVQHRMLEHGAEIWQWLEEGAHFFVCGDAKRMAVDVDRALREIVCSLGGVANGFPREDGFDIVVNGRANQPGCEETAAAMGWSIRTTRSAWRPATC